MRPVRPAQRGVSGLILVLIGTSPQQSMSRSKQAFIFSAERLAKQSLHMWTFTLVEAMDVKQTRKLWDQVMTLLRRRWPQVCGLRVFELHKEHGLHVHLVTNRFVDVNEVRKMLRQAGSGRTHVKRVSVCRGKYLAKYLGKSRPEALKGWRLWAGFGDWEWSKVKDIVVSSPVGDAWKACKALSGWSGKEPFWLRRQVAQRWYHAWLRDEPPSLAMLGFRAL